MFSELNGFVLYEPVLLQNYLEINQLQDRDVLQYFTETEHGDNITKNGIAIPVIGLNTSYYQFHIAFHDDKRSLLLNENETKVSSSGWVFHTESGQLRVAGVGYFKNIDSIHTNNSLTFAIERGWYSVSIRCGEMEGQEELVLEIILKKEKSNPEFYGDLEVSYYF
ncbi:hypothetical protein [Paenibacillus sp. KR2-11]|uniref:hypothetical protein n=1 Tax=Paenibacillus sp. KR2-11 TaxID=3385500 RepID=UPI0038FC14A8